MTCGGKCKQRSYPLTLVVKKPPTAVDANGQFNPDDDSGEVVGKLRASCITKGGKEAYLYKQIQSTVDLIFRVRDTTIAKQLSANPDWWMTLGDRRIDVVACYRVNEVEREFQIEAMETK